jgi:hypothetical protein
MTRIRGAISAHRAQARRWVLRVTPGGIGHRAKRDTSRMRCNRGGRRDFPGAAAFRPISWEEWFENFDQHHCSFVFDNDRSMPLSNTYRIVNADEWKARGP